LYAHARTPRFSRRRRRNPAPAIIAALALLIFGCWVFNLTCGRRGGGGGSGLGEYASRVRSIAEATAGLGQAWNEVRQSLPQLIADTQSLDARLQELESQALDILSQAKAVVPPDDLELAHAALVICLEQRYRSLQNYRPDLINALSAVDLDVYARSLSEDLQGMVYSDGSYAFFRRQVSEAIQAGKVEDVTLPESAWMQDWDSADYESVKTFLVGLKGTEVHGVAVGAVMLKPEGTLVQEAGETVHRLPSTDEVNVTVTVENQGNRSESGVVVRISLYSTINTNPVRQEQTLESMAPGEKVQVVFTGLRPTTGRVRNILEIKVEPVPRETFIDNNQKLIYFTVG